jgi:hypothetical protein
MNTQSKIENHESEMEPAPLLVRAPWLIAIGLFALSLSAWVVFYVLAQGIEMEKVPVQKESVLH